MNAEQLLQSWFDRAPEWARHAYNNDPACHRVMKSCAIAGESEVQMLWRLAGVMYEQKNCWMETAMNQARTNPNPHFPVTS